MGGDLVFAVYFFETSENHLLTQKINNLHFNKILPDLVCVHLNCKFIVLGIYRDGEETFKETNGHKRKKKP